MRFALLLAGGTGTRLGAEIPKQYMEVCGRRLISYSLETLFDAPVHKVQIVAHPAWRDLIREEIRRLPDEKEKFLDFSSPGETRQMSILHGLWDILTIRQFGGGVDTSNDIVLIQDAARPLASESLIHRCLETVEAGRDGAVPVLPMKDTVYQSGDGKKLTGLLKREEIFAGQAPEAFRLEKYLRAVAVLLPERILTIRGSAEPAILAGMDVAAIPGEERNFKITTKEDVERLEQILKGAGGCQ